MTLKRGVDIITRRIKAYLAEEYGASRTLLAFSKDIYDQHRIFLTITFAEPLCSELFAKGRDHTKLFKEIDKEFHKLFKEEWHLYRLTLLNYLDASGEPTGKIMIDCSEPTASYPVNHIINLHPHETQKEPSR